jgi:hypothetical protein
MLPTLNQSDIKGIKMASKDNTTKPKFKKCKVCPNRFEVWSSTTQVCSPTCAIEYARIKTAKKEKKSHSMAKRKLNDENRSLQIKKTQSIFNAYIRLRDNSLPCVSCARTDQEIDYKGVGGKWDCGHYKTRGAYPELRFHPLNAAKQCKKCNGGSGKYSRAGRSVSEGYDIGLLERVGQECFDWLNGPHVSANFTIPDLVLLQAHFKSLTKKLEQEQC